MSNDPVEHLRQALKDRYTIDGPLGEGGMAMVYLAQDRKHNRQVALKVLKPELSAVVGAERFLSEIETTANLQHPHILPLYDSGEADGLLFYVMPYVPGETLRERLDREKQLSVDEGLRIATAVAGALDYAHRHGVVHRDIKPANILIQDGQPVVSDFGIALAVGAGGGARLTETGLSVGTPYYMSPEQATGDQVVGPASDTYSLACVLYEMLVGEPPYLGNTAQAVLGKIIQGEPVSATAARTSVPLHVDHAIRKALERLPADRFVSARDFARALGDPSFRHGRGAPVEDGAGARAWRRAALGLAAAVVLLGATLAWSWLVDTEEPDAVERYASPFLHDQEPDNLIRDFMGLAPDGSLLVYRSGAALWVRRWGDLEAVPVRGAAGGWTPSVSPGGDAVSFWTSEREVKVASLEGGPLQTVLSDVGAWQHWGRDGFIYARAASDEDAFMVRVAADGGAVDTLWSEPDGEIHWVTDVLPDEGKALIFAAGDDDAAPEVRLVELQSGDMTTVVTGVLPRYLDTGDLVYLAADSSLMLAPLDVATGELGGSAVPMVAGVVNFDVSRDGRVLFYTGGDPADQEFELVWASRAGVMESVQPGWTFDPDLDNRGWEISPDGRYIALKARTDLGNDIWIKELPDGPVTRMTYHEAADRRPSWHPDGERVTFVSFRDGGMGVWIRRADAVDEPRAIPGTEGVADAVWTPDGTTLIIRSTGPTGVAGRRDISMLRVGEDTVPTPLLAEEHDEFGPAISPDGRWLAYTSDETGQFEVFVRPFPNVTDGRIQVSDGGGRGAVWGPDGQEIFYTTNGPTIGEGRRFMVAAFRPGPPMAVLRRTALFDLPNAIYIANYTTSVDVGQDGERFLMARVANQETPDRRRFVLVRNWHTEVAGRRR